MSLGFKNKWNLNATLVSNDFIDKYMINASGDYIKVYLYFLRHADESLTIESVAEALRYTEADVKRAFAYWQQVGVLSVGKAAKEAERASDDLPKRNSDLTRLENDEDFKQLLFITEQYLNKAGKLTATDCQILGYLYQDLKMTPELLEYLIEYCAGAGHYSLRYAEKVALNWHENKITTVEQAKTQARGYSKDSFAVMRAMGITGRNPVEAELELMKKWFSTYSFTKEIVAEACARTIRNIHQPSFAYADRILTDWSAAGVRTLSDIEALDRRRKEEKAAKKAEVKAEAKAKPKTANRFHNLEQHGYDYDEMVWSMIHSSQEGGDTSGTE